MGEEDIYKEGNLFVIKKEIEGKMITFGSFNTLEEAIVERDELEEYGWPYLPEEPEQKLTDEDYGQYISKKDNQFMVSRVIRGKEKIFGLCDTLEEAKELKYKLIENAWTFSSSPFKKKSKYGRFIQKDGNKFVIVRSINGKTTRFGPYHTLDDALIAREKLIDENWGVDGEIYYFDPTKYGENITFGFDHFRIKKSFNGQLIDFGSFDTLENATIARDILLENNWDISKVPDNLFSTSFFISHRSFISSWEVSNVIDGDLVCFGFFSTKHDAETAVKILIENNWDIRFVPLNLFSPNSFIYKRDRYYYVVSKINEQLRYHDRFNTYEEARYARDKLLLSGWSIKEEILEEEKFDEYIYLKSDGKYYLKFEDCGKIKVFGIFDDFLEAVDARYECMKDGWKAPCLYEEEPEVELDDKIIFDDIKQIFDSIEIVNEPDLPFPQVDNFKELINISEGLFQNIMSREQIIQVYELQPRQYSFYIAAGEYLGLFEKSNNDIFLSTKGLKIFMKSEKEKNLSLVHLILEHKPFYDVFRMYLENNKIPHVNEIFLILKENNIYNISSDVTLKRRATSVRSWIKWIVNLYED